MYTVYLPIKNIKQETGTYCGAACAQMLLNKIKYKQVTQTTLYRDNRHNSRYLKTERWWASPPDGLTRTINNRTPRSFKNKFDLIAKGDSASIAREIIWALEIYQIPSIALIENGDHWILIKGFTTTGAIPRSSTDTIPVIQDFWANDPWNEPARIVHNPIDWAHWQTSIMVPVPHGHWRSKCICICDPTSVGEEDGRKRSPKKRSTSQFHEQNSNVTPVSSARKKYTKKQEKQKVMANAGRPNLKSKETVKLFNRKRKTKWLQGGKIIDKSMVKENAFESLSTRGYRELSFLKKVLRGVRAANPILVYRLDAMNQFYYLVPMVDSNNRICSIVNIDGSTGDYLESAFAKDKKRPIAFEPLSEKQIFKLLGKRLKLEGERAVLGIFPELVCIYPSLVWKPCLESFSPYLPFHMVIIGSYTIFVRIDGKLFTKLTTGVRGA